MRQFITKARSQEGATATEYMFLLIFIAIALIVGATALGDVLDAGFDEACNEVNDELAAGPGC